MVRTPWLIHRYVWPLYLENSDEEDRDYGIDEEKTIFSLRFVLPDQRDLDDLYDAIAECQALNPDPEDLSEGEFGSVQDYENGNEGTFPCPFRTTSSTFAIRRVSQILTLPTHFYARAGHIDDNSSLSGISATTCSFCV